MMLVSFRCEYYDLHCRKREVAALSSRKSPGSGRWLPTLRHTLPWSAFRRQLSSSRIPAGAKNAQQGRPSWFWEIDPNREKTASAHGHAGPWYIGHKSLFTANPTGGVPAYDQPALSVVGLEKLPKLTGLPIGAVAG